MGIYAVLKHLNPSNKYIKTAITDLRYPVLKSSVLAVFLTIGLILFHKALY